MQDYYDSILPLSNRLYRYAYLLRAYSKFEQYQMGTSPLAWLLVILRSIFINKYRKKKREGNLISFEDVASGEERIVSTDYRDLPEAPDEVLFRNTLDSELRDALHKLPSHYLEVILLVDMEDMSYRETSDILNIPPGTVMSRLHRARKILQEQLQDLARKKGIIKTRIKPIYEHASKKAGGVHGA